MINFITILIVYLLIITSDSLAFLTIHLLLLSPFPTLAHWPPASKILIRNFTCAIVNAGYPIERNFYHIYTIFNMVSLKTFAITS